MSSKTVSKLFTLLVLGMASCSGDELSNDQAQHLLTKSYPRAIETFIYCGDPGWAKKLQDAGLDSEGYVTVKKTKKWSDTTGWVSFTEKAAPYLLETAANDKKDLVQKVKAAEEQFDQIIHLHYDNENAEVTYTTKISAITPFGKLIKLKEGEVKEKTTYVMKEGNEWHLKEKAK